MILALLLLTSRAVCATADPSAAWLFDSLGLDGFDLLQQRGLIVAQGKPGERAVRWFSEDGLQDLAAQADGLVSLEDAWAAFAASRPAPDLRPLPKVLLSPAARAAAQLLAAFPADLAELGRADVPVAQMLASTAPLLFETTWGREFSARSHAEISNDALPLARPFFDAYLAEVRPNPAAVRHFLASLSELRRIEAGPVLAADAVAGMPSEQLRAWIARYLSDQRHIYTLKRASAELHRLDRTARVSGEIALAARIGRAVSANREWLGTLKDAAARGPAAAGPAKLSSSGLHLGRPGNVGVHEMGDRAVVSGAVWVDGLGEGGSAEVEQTTFFAYALGAAGVETTAAKRGGGGPYLFSRDFPLTDSRRASAHSILSAPGAAPVADVLEVPISGDFEKALDRLAVADALLQSCDYLAADELYAGLRSSFAQAARRKPQYAALLKRADEGRAEASRLSTALGKVEEAGALALPDSSIDRCRYDEDRTQEALTLARRLPAGCGARLPALDLQLSIIRKRAADQRAFAAAASRSRERSRACDPGGAADWAAQGFSILAADPGARCGATAADAAALERELIDAIAARLWSADFEAALSSASAETSVEKRLSAGIKTSARIASLPGARCRTRLSSQAEVLASRAGDSYAGPEAKAALDLLPPDNDLPQTSAAVALERRRILDEEASLERQKAEQQDPAELAKPAPQAAPEVRLARPKIKPKGGQP